MQRYFCNDLNNNEFILNNNDSYHIKTVMRMNINDLIEIVYNEKVYICHYSICNMLDCSGDSLESGCSERTRVWEMSK